eukprot:CAMPEP_0174278878 /NCGR_PEP_ID=MMETSP0439-20130205/61716_1 /TAXON_ID=0 /ORGANISM="Stereomyxa ramosa, Strain Chinc5" /LENGTH=147 /DNA_ID=CAMNT_0015371327 /DNA_START=45 /DNA_END=488 /DNA_ORIENTATION=-
MAHLIVYIKELCLCPDNKIIVFSQWDRMLQKVGATLQENGIPNSFCKGSVHARNKAIGLFTETTQKQKEVVRVIMLSLEKAASGTNLTEATHVIMIDPVSGTKAHARSIEMQAIGRAHRQGRKKSLTLVRLITKGTIEEQIYLQNCT